MDSPTTRLYVTPLRFPFKLELAFSKLGCGGPLAGSIEGGSRETTIAHVLFILSHCIISLGLQIVQSRSYLRTLGPKVGIIDILGAPGFPMFCCCRASLRPSAGPGVESRGATDGQPLATSGPAAQPPPRQEDRPEFPAGSNNVGNAYFKEVWVLLWGSLCPSLRKSGPM